jgi:serine/threonine-protein kinase
LSQASYVLADRYRLDERIATGGMGEVWRAVDLVLGRPVAVKLLRDDYAQHPETLERFRAEARHTAAVSHPGIAQMYDYGEPRPGQPPFLVMELVDGAPLTELLERGPLDPARVMDLVAQAAAGLSAAHAAGLVHRDIKPGNLLISPDGTVKITDFGIAHAAGSAPLTRTGALIGTPAYLAPERVTGASAGPASDLYSLGIVAHECLTGAQPFTGTPIEVALSHQYQPLPPLPPAVPLPVAALVAELTARDSAGRPADAGEVAARAARLRDALGGAATQENPWLTSQAGAGNTDIRYGALPPAWPGPPGQTGPDGVTLHDVGLYDAGMYGPERPGRRGARRRDTRRPARGHALLVLAAAAVAVIVGLTGWMLVSGASSAAPPAPRHPAAARHPTTAVASMVTVPADLGGQPFTDVVQQLRTLGLKVKLTWVPTDQEDPGTVLSVHPVGPVRRGTTVTVTVAAHHHHDNGDGNGHGGGQ